MPFRNSPAARRPDLTQVTLLAATGVAHAATLAAMSRSLAQVRFAQALLLSDRPAANTVDGIACRQIKPLRSYDDYSRFVLARLADHVTTSHVLLVQWDGFVTDAGQWDEAFLDYDYVGAPWSHFRSGPTVGNGGFSLRSRRLLAACAQIRLGAGEAEDVAICRRYRPMLERDLGIRFAPPALAARFAREHASSTGRTFGFHGVRNLPAVLGRGETAALLRDLDEGLIRRGEARDMAVWALRRGEFRLARALLGRWHRAPRPARTAARAGAGR